LSSAKAIASDIGRAILGIPALTNSIYPSFSLQTCPSIIVSRLKKAPGKIAENLGARQRTFASIARSKFNEEPVFPTQGGCFTGSIRHRADVNDGAS